MSEAQPVVETPTPSPIVKTGGASPTSFDELDDVMSSKPEPKVEKEAKGEEPDEPEVKAKGEETEEKDDEKKLLKRKAEIKQKEKADLPKVYKYKVGDKEFDISADTPFEVRVDGKKETAKFQDLIDNYAGKQNWHRKFQEIDSKRQEFEKGRANLQNAMNEVYNMAAVEKNPRGAIEYLAEIMGAEPSEVWANFESQVVAASEEWSKLSPEERRLRKAEEENQYRRAKDEKRRAYDLQAKQVRETEARLAAVKQEYGMDDRAVVQAYDSLVKDRRVDPKDITPEMVGKHHEELTKMQTVGDLFDELEIEVDTEGKMMKQVHDIWIANRELSKEDVQDIITQVYGGKSAKNLSRKIKRAAPANTAKPSPERKANPISFDDLD